MLNPLCKQPVMVTPGVVMAGRDGKADFPGEPQAVADFTQQHPGPGPVT